jgi:hypothetical protein
VRLKIGLLPGSGDIRPFFLLGGGFYYGRLPTQVATNVTVVPHDNHSMPGTTGDVLYPAAEAWGGQLTLGAGVDYFFNAPFGVSMFWLDHISVTENARVPDNWMEIALGIRFGP